MTTALIKTLEGLEKKATTRPWKVEANEKDSPSGHNWFVIPSLGQSLEDNKFYCVTTDGVHASELDGDAKFDAELIVELRNSLPQIISALKDAERMREGLRFASGDTENKLCYVCGKNHYGEWKYDCPIYKASTPTADTKERDNGSRVS